jgi:hypothetical protein
MIPPSPSQREPTTLRAIPIRVRRFTGVALSILVLAAPAARADAPVAATEPPASRLVGTWRLHSFVEVRPSGEVVPSGRYGPNVTGRIVYDAAGNMMAQLANPDRPKFAADSAMRGTPEEIKRAFEGYNAYFGTYVVDEASGTIRHRVESNLFPNAVGTEFTRRFRLDGDELTLELPPAAIQGEQRVVRLVWRRVD